MPDGISTKRAVTEKVWLLPTGEHALPDGFGAGLPGAMVPLRPRRGWITFCDTYDWELHFSGLALLHNAGRLLLCRAGGCSSQSALAVQPWKGHPPAAIMALGASDLRHEIERVAELSTLLSVVRIHRFVQPFEVRNVAGKVVLRLRLESFSRTASSPEPVVTLLRLSPCRGFAEHEQTFTRLLLEAGLQAAETATQAAILPHLCAIPTPAAVHPKLLCPPSTACRQAVFGLASAMLAATRHYEAGIIADVDVECLHRYRVLLRRTRSLLGLMKSVLPVEDMQVLRQELALIAARTNRLRDLDVFLATLPDCAVLLPEPLRPGLAGVTAEARRERGLERGRVLSLLRSRDYAARMDRLAVACAAPDSYASTPLAGEPVDQASRQRLWKQCRAVLKAIPALRSAPASDSELHRLRIGVKKARYLLEIFGGFLDPEAVALLTARCRQLQSALGEVTDLGAQQTHVLALLERRGAAAASVFETAAVGALAAALFARQKQARKAVAKHLDRFLGQRTRKAIRHFRAVGAEASP
jgi:CHAD domain-containing protein